MKKFFATIGVVLLLGFILGYSNTILHYNDVWVNFFKGTSSVPIYIHLLYAIIALYMAIFFHELGHFIAFKRLGINVKAMYVLCFAFVKIDGRWKVKFIPKFLLLLGGIVIPDVIPIRSSEDELIIVEKFKKVLIAGPNASIIYGAVVVLTFLAFFLTPFYLLNGFLFTYALITSIMTILAILSSRIAKGGMYGDYAAIKALDLNKSFRLSYFLQIVNLVEKDEKSVDYLWPQIVKYLEKFTKVNDRIYLTILSFYLDEVTFQGRISCISIDDKLERIEKGLSKGEDGLMIYHFMLYFYQSRKNYLKVEEMLAKKPSIEFKVDQKVFEYYERLTNHLLGKSDESTYLSNSKNNYSSSTAWIYAPLELKEDFKKIE